MRFWLDKGVDGFHVLNAEYLYEDENLGDDILITGKAGNVRNCKEILFLCTMKLMLKMNDEDSMYEMCC